MKTCNYRYFAPFLMFAACTSKSAEIKDVELRQNCLSENTCVEQSSDSVILPLRSVKFIPPVIVDCEDLELERKT